ncbi:MAG TPA: tRNA lysidine(34) synthetase TilS [Stellaceae bacterium]|nr:tRNA lysidine(34) synthetase TilS [Stellaceae bacterium]
MRSDAASAADAAPLTVSELSAALAAIGGFEARPHVAVGVSGGPDSMALTLLAERWAEERGGRAIGLTVDHRLRPESAAEARLVAGWLAARGIPHEILVRPGDRPARGIQEAARAARYALLAGWCRAHGVLHLFVAHHREDQAETHVIRRGAGSGVDGLAAMSAVRELDGCRLVRPLLAVPRTRLAAFLADAGQPFLHDPSNLNPAFERVRLRLGGWAVPPDEILERTQACGRARIERGAALDRLIGRAVALHPAGFAVVGVELLATAGGDGAERLLARLAAGIGGGHYPPRRARLARLRAGLAGMPDRARTLGGCRFVRWRGRLLVLRELAAAAAPVGLEPGANLVWDRRFAVTVPAAARPMTLGYLGQSGAATLAGRSPACDLPPLVHPVLPALWDAAGLVAVPHLGYRRDGVGALPSFALSSPNGITSAGFTVV